MEANQHYKFCIYFTRLLYGGKIKYDDYLRTCDKKTTEDIVTFYLTSKDITNVKVEYYG
jgi:hypothetical protein